MTLRVSHFGLLAIVAIACGAPRAHPDLTIAATDRAPTTDAETAEIPDAGAILPDAGNDADAETMDAEARNAIDPPWAQGTTREQLFALRVDDDTWARQDLFTWTTRAQVDALRTSRALLVATARTGGPPSPFVWLLDSLANRHDAGGSIAALLAHDPRFVRRRYAWTATYATVLGLATRTYGDELVRVTLKDDAWILMLAPERDRDSRISVRDVFQREIPLDRALREPERIAAVYHVRLGKDVPSRFREYVIVNEREIERWELGTPHVRAEVDAELSLLRALKLEIVAHPDKPAYGPFAAWRTVDPSASATLRTLWEGTTAFENDRYQLDAARLDRAITALSTYNRDAPELSVSP